MSRRFGKGFRRGEQASARRDRSRKALDSFRCLENNAWLRRMKRQSAAGGGSDELAELGQKQSPKSGLCEKGHEHRSGWAWWN